MTKSLKKVRFSRTEGTESKILKRLMRPQVRAAVFFISLVAVLAGCKNPEEEIGIELQPEEDLLSALKVDTVTIKAYTVLDDSVRTDNLSPALIGAYTDPVFGYTKASHVTQLRLSSNNPNLIPQESTLDNIEVDSVILYLDYYRPGVPNPHIKEVYGSLGEQYFNLYEITHDFSDSVYFEYSPVTKTGEDWIKPGFNYQTPNPDDFTVIGEDTVPAPMIFPLREEFADRFFEASEDGELNATTFKELINGIYITVDESKFSSSQAGLIGFDTFTGNSHITMYYRNVMADSVQSHSYSFLIRSNSIKYGRFKHDYSIAHPGLRQQLEGDTELGKQDLFIQGAAGTKIKLELPYINSLREVKNIAVNEAKIILPVRDEDLSKYPSPRQLVIFALDEEDEIYSLQYDNPFNHGFYNPDTKAYEFKITRYLQQVLSGSREHYGFEIVSISSGNMANRAILNGVEYTDSEGVLNNLKLELTITKF